MLSLFKRLRKGAAAVRASATVAQPGGGPVPAPVAGIYLDLLLGGARLHRDEVLSTPEKIVGQAVAQMLRSSEQRAAAVPRLPTLLPLLLKQLRDPLASSRDYATLIMQDPLISPTVLRVANSVYFNPYRKSLDNFERVVADLGVVKLRMVLSAAVMQPVLLGSAESLPQRIWQHSLDCAAVCQGLAQREGVDPYLGYLTGLIHDIGVVTLYNQVQQMQREYLAGAQPGHALLQDLMATWGKILTVSIAEDWQLPAEVVQALKAQTDADQDCALGRTLRRANGLCEAHTVYRAGLIDAPAFQDVAQRLGIPPALVQSLEQSIGKL